MSPIFGILKEVLLGNLKVWKRVSGKLLTIIIKLTERSCKELNTKRNTISSKYVIYKLWGPFPFKFLIHLLLVKPNCIYINLFFLNLNLSWSKC